MGAVVTINISLAGGASIRVEICDTDITQTPVLAVPAGVGAATSPRPAAAPADADPMNAVPL